MSTSANTPKHAIRKEYQSGRRVGIYYTWRAGITFYWSASGADGEAPTLEAAESAAREWIKFGSKSQLKEQ